MAAPIVVAGLPTVTSLGECASFTKTVAPFLHQFSLTHVLPLFRGDVAPKTWYLATNPVISATLAALAISLFCFVSAEINRNYSQVDRLWSIVPALYMAHFAGWAHLNGVGSERVNTMAMFVTLWSMRLTFNFWRKGGYAPGGEDYRWAILRQHIPPLAFVVFDLSFVAIFQNLLLVAITFPAYILLLSSRIPGATGENDTTDTVFSRALVIVLCIETLADQQQWAYQKAKHHYNDTGVVPFGYTKEDLDRGFVVTGLWALCRHPNFACEQVIWFGVYTWACLRSDTMWNWTAVGVTTYWAIFQGSTNFTESISAGKYSEYSEYQALVNKFVPGWKTIMGEKEKEPVKKEGKRE